MAKNPKREISDEEAISLIAEGVIQNARDIQSSVVDPFEVYTYHVQAKIFADNEFFKEHCLEGYRTLMKKNNNPKNGHMDN